MVFFNEVARRTLTDFNFEIEEGYDGQQCLDKVKVGNEYDLILMVIMMPNMSGETAIARLKENPDSGIITIRKNAKIGLLKQIPFLQEENISVQEFLNRSFEEVYKIEIKLKELENKMTVFSGQDLEKILNQYADLQQKFIDLDGYTIESKINEICNKFRIDGNLLSRRVSDLSGGESTIISLASIMLSNPDILLLDEPTNNLDIDTLEWLEGYLKNYSGTIIISSHDRYFLDQVTAKTVLIEQGKK